ncbi:uroporphyrinogen-III synthase [Methylomonas sp. MED-D]|uniref:uroporphyrinogen-III synthase n=1 Tax=Methylomonas sp. MED-D TaxID=3418768 RepID=UPI003CFD6380
MTPGLRGARILVTRPTAQAQRLCGLIESAGGQAIRFPVLEIVAEALAEPSLQLAAASDWLIFTSTNAVDFAIAAFGGKMPGLHRPRIAAVGEATAGALRAAGWPVDCVPASDFSSEGLLAEAPMQAVAEQRCVIVRGVGGREKLAEALRARGAEVAYLEVYRRVRPATDTTELIAALAAGRLSATTMTSLEALENLLAMLDETSVAALRALPLVVVSERIGAAATELGFSSVAVCRQPADAAILETLTTILNGENSGGSN